MWKHGFREHRLAEQKVRSGSGNGNKKKTKGEKNDTDKNNFAYMWFLIIKKVERVVSGK